MLIKIKKAMTLSIVFLVLATLVLTSFSLFIFYQREKSIQEEIYITRFLDELYIKEEQINFYLNEIMKNAAANSKNEEEFINNFKSELEKYKSVEPELSQIESQLNNIEVLDKEAKAEFKIVLEENFIKKGKVIFSAVYTYKEKFEKPLIGYS